MSETIDYAEMLEIPVNTLNVVKKKSRKKKNDELKDRVVDAVNKRMTAYDEAIGDAKADVRPQEEEGEAGRIAYSEDVTEYVADPPAEEKPKKKFFEGKLLVVEFAAVLALCATILLTNIFMPNSAINTFFSNLTAGEPAAAQVDDRSYSELTLGSVVSDTSIECTVSDTGILTFTGECSVYAPYGGTVVNVAEQEGLYTIEIEHTTSFSSVISGLSSAYLAAGDPVYATIPVGYSTGDSEVSVSMYDGDSIIASYSVNEDNDIVWNA